MCKTIDLPCTKICLPCVYFVFPLLSLIRLTDTTFFIQRLFLLLKHVYFFLSLHLLDTIHAPLFHTGCGEERRGRGGGESKKRKSANGGRSKALRKRMKRTHRTVARHFAFCRWRAVAGTVWKSKTRRR